jgi:quercetin dioxygenase-like cupin family protein
VVTTSTLRELVLSAADVEQRRGEHGVEETPGVRRTVLWEHAGSAAGVLEVDAGATIGEHAHPGHGHHVWVVEGTARVLGRELAPGSYWFVPSGRPHALEASGDGAVRVFYVYEADAG